MGKGTPKKHHSIENQPNHNTAGFAARPWNIYRGPKKRKSFALFNEVFEEAGIQPLSKDHLLKAYQLVLNSTQAELDAVAEDDSTPLGLKIIIKELQNKDTAAKAMKDLRDYTFDKAATSEETYDKRALTPEENEKIDEALDDIY